ncbi:unannotated protein [freshwater metagenome]|uniref:Unannotated protein n=1 Tax=freshwater metagenome TaxID=449393 RepID=A0A6J6ZP18_9ZZZZ
MFRDSQKVLIFIATTVDVATPVPQITKTFFAIYTPIDRLKEVTELFQCIAEIFINHYSFGYVVSPKIP